MYLLIDFLQQRGCLLLRSSLRNTVTPAKTHHGALAPPVLLCGTSHADTSLDICHTCHPETGAFSKSKPPAPL